MSKRHGEIDNHFSPSSQNQGCLFSLIFGVVLVDLALGLWALSEIAVLK
ncbi:hypothetical protein [Rhizobium alvei]|uniref:Uncharacterized protein n=1 Tax=Rhizobium alvei TaxID=1132659 RepID=A0ABT8YU51_9HYPH|nr:hypothetical protein [Rhizobium alvei]MDO6967025.1 hypothetical protein [Rhizobium alvei]